MAEEVKSLRSKIENIEGTLKEANAKSKDAWDKVAAASGLISGILVALIGGIATYIYNERQRISEEARSQRESAIAEVQTVQSFLVHLQSQDIREREAALLAIAALGNPSLAARLADLYRGEAGLGALSKLSVSSNVDAAEVAKRALHEVFKRADLAVALIKLDAEEALGIVISGNGLILTTDYVGRRSEEPEVRLSDGSAVTARVLARNPKFGLSLLSVSITSLHWITVEEVATALPGDKIFIRYRESKGLWLFEMGEVLGLVNSDNTNPAPLQLLQLRGKIGHGSAGAPAFDARGRFAGLVYGFNNGLNSIFLVPAANCAEFLQQAVNWNEPPNLGHQADG